MSTCSYELALKDLKLSKQLQIGLVAISKGSVVAWLVSLILNIFFFLGEFYLLRSFTTCMNDKGTFILFIWQ